MTIREVEASDYSACIEFWKLTLPNSLRERDDSAAGFERFLKRNEGLSFLAEEDGRLMATMLCGFDGKRAFIYHAAVSPDARRRGLGSELEARVREAALAAGASRISLSTGKENNQTGNGFWAALGYELRPAVNFREKMIREDNDHIKF